MTGTGQPEDAVGTFEAFAVSRSPRLLRLAARLLGDPYLAEDAVQEVLAKVYVRWRRIALMDNTDGYVTTVLVRHCSRWWRTTLRRPAVLRADLGELGGLNLTTHEDTGRQVTERDLVWRCLAALSPRQRQVLVLRHYEDLADSEIARVLGMTESTVRNHAFHGSARLRLLVRGDGDDDGSRR